MMKWDMTMTVIRLEEPQNENPLLDFIFVINQFTLDCEFSFGLHIVNLQLASFYMLTRLTYFGFETQNLENIFHMCR